MAYNVEMLQELQLRTATGFLFVLLTLISIQLDPFIFSLVIVATFSYIWFVEWPRIAPTDQVWSLLGALWLGIPCALLLAINTHPKRYLLTPFFITVWIHDSAAYLIGKKYGKTPLAPEISPGKTIEGFLGGGAATILWLLYASVMDIIPIWWPLTPLIGIIIAICATIGDLFESWLKRKARVKNSGDLLPGHGGILDRLDSVLPLTFLLYFWLFTC